MLKSLESRYTVPSRQHITDIAVPNLYKEVKSSVQEQGLINPDPTVFCLKNFFLLQSAYGGVFLNDRYI